MKKLIRAPYVTNVLLFIIACELLLLPRRKEVLTMAVSPQVNPPTMKQGEYGPTSFEC
jgi:hypothetical protein